VSQDTSLFYALRHPNPDRRREAIVGVARQGVLEAIPVLSELAEDELDPELRALAGKALRHLKKRQESQLTDPLGLDTVSQQLDEAYQVYQQQGGEAAAPLLSKVLKLDPDLADHPTAKKIASASINPPEAQNNWQSVRRRSPVRWLIVLVMAVVTAFLFFRTGVLNTYISSIQSGQWRENLRREGDIDYYLFVPEGRAPASGWGSLVVLHEFGYGADSLLPWFVEKAQRDGIVLIAPVFGEYPQPIAETTSRLDAILIRVREEYPMDSTGAVIFGHGVGGEVAMLYARDYFGVGAVAAFGAPNLYEPPLDDPALPYLFMYGEYDSQLAVLQDVLHQFQTFGNPGETLTIPDVDTEMNAQVADTTIELTRQLYLIR
jgi:hypothetical protein